MSSWNNNGLEVKFASANRRVMLPGQNTTSLPRGLAPLTFLNLLCCGVLSGVWATSNNRTPCVLQCCQ